MSAAAIPARRRLAALRRPARVTLVACLVFYIGRYLLDAPTLAVYALFTAIALGALSDVSGPPTSRTRTFLGAVLVGLPLVTIGTLAAASTVAAVVGMLVVGFVLAYAGVTGPRVQSVAPGLQLFYVLPCFPPYAPDTLDERLAGLVIGGLLLALADRVLWPDPAPRSTVSRLADAAELVAAFAAELADRLGHGPVPTDLPGRAEATAAATALRMRAIPAAERPIGPGARDRSLLAAAAATRIATARLAVLADLLSDPDEPPHPHTAALVSGAGTAFGQVAAALRAGGAPPGTGCVDTVLDAYVDEHAHRLDGAGPVIGLRPGLAAVTVAEEARLALVAAGGIVGAPPPADPPPPLWFLRERPAALWWHRLRTHVTPHSVHLQNAVRLALGLAAARAVAGVLDLSHGFWVLLATLSLMRTSSVAGRAVLPQALAGTLAGAVVAGAALTLVGDATDVYAWALPPVMVLAFAAGPVLGLWAGQAGFTVVVSLLFAQLAPSTWELAGTRLLDVLVGGVVGAVVGAAVWPRGGSGEIRRAAAAALRAGADVVDATAARLTGGGTRTGPDLARANALFEQTYIQYRSEPHPYGPEPDWLAVLAVAQRIDTVATVLRARHPDTDALPWPDAAHRIGAAAARLAIAYRAAADAIGAGRPLPAGAGAAICAELAGRPADGVAPDRESALRVLDAWAWLLGLADDLSLLERVERSG
ncbi:FUSC family protein [Pseudonocardia sp. CA-107938]|uniref:FUSC family protein n=1 Tax=Pseudonocardia sp. CA-107938 TaxID=3240021 RepID=UPI003D935E32